jgi:hypothetical protein
LVAELFGGGVLLYIFFKCYISLCKNVTNVIYITSAGDVREERKEGGGETPSGDIGRRSPEHPHLFVLLDPNPHFKKFFLTRTKQLPT